LDIAAGGKISGVTTGDVISDIVTCRDDKGGPAVSTDILSDTACGASNSSAATGVVVSELKTDGDQGIVTPKRLDVRKKLIFGEDLDAEVGEERGTPEAIQVKRKKRVEEVFGTPSRKQLKRDVLEKVRRVETPSSLRGIQPLSVQAVGADCSTKVSGARRRNSVDLGNPRSRTGSRGKKDSVSNLDTNYRQVLISDMFGQSPKVLNRGEEDGCAGISKGKD